MKQILEQTPVTVLKNFVHPCLNPTEWKV